MPQGCAENSNLASLQIEKIFRLELPLDLRIARQRSRAGAGDVGEDAVKVGAVWQSQRVRGNYFYVLLRSKPAQERRAMRMQLSGDDLCFRQPRGHSGGLAAGSGAAIKNAPALADQGSYQLRAFVLNGGHSF